MLSRIKQAISQAAREAKPNLIERIVGAVSLLCLDMNNSSCMMP